ncbi:MAG: flagellar hook-associated protein FlgL [Lachnospiraceae bacterium]|nr:flagellar hook-associated protein FlgL [Lachnospiraceae bacterium]
MRITNKMMTNNALYNINNNKNIMSPLENQYSTGKKITKPSDDPLVAVRALKFRTNLTELNQYYEKNIPDALEWMDVTESALDNVNGIITSMNTYCNQGANDYPTAEDRNSIVENLKQLKAQLYQEGNTNYAGRYVFSGYKTDTPLVFNESTTNLQYKITEPLVGTDIKQINKVINQIDIDDYNPNDLASWDDTMPSEISVYRLQLSYDTLMETAPVITYKDKNGDDGAALVVNQISSLDVNAYRPAAGEVNFIADTGEIIIGEALYDSLRTASEISVTYEKNSFDENELRPEHYFNCTCIDTEDPNAELITYTKQDQQIQYEINFNQKICVNTQGSDAFTTGISRMIDDIVNSVNEVKAVEDQISEVDNMLKDTSVNDEQRAKLKSIKEQLQSEFTIKTALMTEAFSSGIQITEDEQEGINIALADLGGRYKRVQLTESRLSDQQVDFTDILSKNEDVNLVDTIVKYTSAQTVYNSSLSAAAKLVQSSLLDFL